MVGKGKRKIEAIGYMRTSSATNVGRDKDSEQRQRVAIESFAKATGYTIVDWFYDPAVKGSDAVTERPGFKSMLDRREWRAHHHRREPRPLRSRSRSPARRT
jgi:Resolvase, N terminal domain